MSFTSEVSDFSDEALVKLDLLVRKVSLDVGMEVVRRSPVDSGRFRGNWQPSIGTALTGELEVLDPQPLGSNPGSVVMSKLMSTSSSMAVGLTFFFVNNLDYAEDLEYGKSMQAPQGMVTLTVQRWQPLVDKAVEAILRDYNG